MGSLALEKVSRLQSSVWLIIYPFTYYVIHWTLTLVSFPAFHSPFFPLG